MSFTSSDLFPIAQYLRAAHAGQLEWDTRAETYVLHGAHVPKGSDTYHSVMSLAILGVLAHRGDDGDTGRETLRVWLGPTTTEPTEFND